MPPLLSQTSALLAILVILGTSCDVVSCTGNYSDCGTNYTTLERALLDTGNNYYKLWATYYPPEKSPPLYIDITYNFKDQEGNGNTNDTISFISVAAAVFFMQPPNVFGLTSLFFGHTVHNRVVSLEVTLPHECYVLINDTESEDGLLPPFLEVLSQRMKLYASYYSQRKIALNDNYLISLGDRKGRTLENKFRTGNNNINLFISVLILLPVVSLVLLVIITRGALEHIREVFDEIRVTYSFHASFSSTIAIGFVFSLFVLGMDVSAIYEVSLQNKIFGYQAKHRFQSLPLYWVTVITLFFDLSSFVIGLLHLIALCTEKSSKLCFKYILFNIFCCFNEEEGNDGEEVEEKERKMWLLTASFIAPVVCFSSHLGYCVIAWFSFPSTAAAVLIMYSLTFVVYFVVLRQLYKTIVNAGCCSKSSNRNTEEQQPLTTMESQENRKEISCKIIGLTIGVGILMVLCQVWLTSGLILLPISNIIESAPHYLQSVGSTAFVTITGLLALNLLVIKPRKQLEKQQEEMFEVVVKTCKSINEKRTQPAADCDGGPADGPAGHGDDPAGHGDDPAGRNDGPAGHGDDPAGRNDGPAGRNDSPAGRNGGPAGRNGGLAGRNGGPAGRNGGPAGRNGGPAGRNGGPAGRNGGPAGRNGVV